MVRPNPPIAGRKWQATNGDSQEPIGRAISSYERPPQEMVEKSRMRETFFSLRTTKQERPSSQPSVHTEFMGTDWEADDDEIVSEFEDGENSPRVSLNSVSNWPPPGGDGPSPNVPC